jgi:hypothetical protein
MRHPIDRPHAGPGRRLAAFLRLDRAAMPRPVTLRLQRRGDVPAAAGLVHAFRRGPDRAARHMPSD